MKKTVSESKQCENDPGSIDNFYGELTAVVDSLLETCKAEECFDNVDSTPFPSRGSLIGIIDKTRRIIFPGYFSQTKLDSSNLKYYQGQETAELFEGLSNQIVRAIRHDCLRFGQPCSHCIERSHDAAQHFIRALPEFRCVLAADVRASLMGDPAAKSFDEVIFSYPGLFAITVYRLAHKLHELHVPLLPRMMTEYAHSLTGIDIHPGARIGESFFMDHGTGIVVGETTEIGDRARLYQGVTLGALSVSKDAVDSYRDRKRHPTIEDDVIIYSNTTVLGGETVIGARSIIGGNIWLTESVPPDTKVILKKPELIYIGNNKESGEG